MHRSIIFYGRLNLDIRVHIIKECKLPNDGAGTRGLAPRRQCSLHTTGYMQSGTTYPKATSFMIKQKRHVTSSRDVRHAHYSRPTIKSIKSDKLQYYVDCCSKDQPVLYSTL